MEIWLVSLFLSASGVSEWRLVLIDGIDKAYEYSQKYKEGKFILEKAMTG